MTEGDLEGCSTEAAGCQLDQSNGIRGGVFDHNFVVQEIELQID